VEAIKRFGAAAWGQAQNLWKKKLQPKIEAKPTLQESVESIPQEPGNEDAQATFRLQLKKLLTEDTIIARDVAQF